MSKKLFPNGVLRKYPIPGFEARFPKDVRTFMEDFNKRNPDMQQPITDKILVALSEILNHWFGGLTIDRIKAWTGNYHDEFSLLTEGLENEKLQSVEFIFNGIPVKIESEALKNQIKNLLRGKLKINVPKLPPLDKKKSPRTKTIESVRPLIDLLKKEHISDQFLSEFFNMSLANFRKTLTRTHRKKSE